MINLTNFDPLLLMEMASPFEISTDTDFQREALRLFYEQAREIPVYGEFLEHLGIRPEGILSIEEIPFLPVSFFKTHRVLRSGKHPQKIFRSSGTRETGARAYHYVPDPSAYDAIWYQGFLQRYGPPSSYRILALLPSYAEREDASLVHMVKGLMDASGHPENGFFLRDLEALKDRLMRLENKAIPTLLIGVSFALLDMAEKHPMPLKNCIVMETGGMKGRRKEMVREELHQRLIEAFGLERVHSEYGMTELFSQAYSKGDGIFYPPPWMGVWVREIEDPFSFLAPGRGGGLNVIDLANRDSCAFIALDDLGKRHGDGSFEVLGRIDGSDVRGCNLIGE
ncbi:MAG: acyl transferase [Flavobacteriales bacterium]